MSTIGSYETACAICGGSSKQGMATSASTFGSPDLDGRPASMLRETMQYWVEECPHCGYVNHKISKPCGVEKDELQQKYDRVNEDEGSPLLMKFIKSGWLMERTGMLQRAVFDFLRAAWVCDDEGKALGAFTYRDISIGLADQCLADSNLLYNWAELLCLQMDMYRRIGAYQNVLLLSSPDPKFLPLLGENQLRLMNFQAELAANSDHSAHKMEEIPGYNGDMGSMLFFIG